MEMRLLLVEFIVSIGLISIQPSSETNDDARAVQENFRNLFNSISKNDLQKTDTYRDALGLEAEREDQAFNKMKDTLLVRRQKNAGEHRHLDQPSVDPHQRVAAFKRQAEEPSKWRVATLEAEWKRFHPKPRHLPNRWHEIDGLTHEMHKRICDDVAYQIMDWAAGETIKNFTYVNATDIKKERIIVLPVEFQFGIRDRLPLRLVICKYEQREFYLAHGGEDTVFRMVDDPEKGVIFKSGQHRVLYDPYKWGEKTTKASAEEYVPGMFQG